MGDLQGSDVSMICTLANRHRRISLSLPPSPPRPCSNFAPGSEPREYLNDLPVSTVVYANGRWAAPAIGPACILFLFAPALMMCLQTFPLLMSACCATVNAGKLQL